jgi:hypothetical protein
MIYIGRVKVYCLFHQPQTQDARIEINILLRIIGHGSDVVETVNQLHNSNIELQRYSRDFRWGRVISGGAWYISREKIKGEV